MQDKDDFAAAVDLARPMNDQMVRLARQIETALAGQVQAVLESRDVPMAGRLTSLLPDGKSRDRLTAMMDEERHARFALTVDPGFTAVQRVPSEDTVALQTLLPATGTRDFGTIPLYQRVDQVFADTPLAGVDGPTLFSYLHRRFGPPALRADSYKQLGGAWILSTPDPDLVLKVTPTLAEASYQFEPLVVGMSEDERKHADHRRLIVFLENYRISLMDLLRPVGVRKGSLNALGSRFARQYATSRRTGADQDLVVPPHAASGAMVPADLMSSPGWDRLCAVLGAYPGGAAAGRDVVIERETRRLAKAFRTTATPAAIAVALSHMWDRESQAIGDMLDPGDADFILAGALAIPNPRPDLVYVGDLPTDADFAAAQAFLESVSVNHAIPSQRHTLLANRAAVVAKAALEEIVAASGLPDWLMEDGKAWDRESARVECVRLRTQGNFELADWIDETLASCDDGWLVASRLVREAMSSQAAPAP